MASTNNEVDESRPQNNALQTVMRVVSVFPCFPSYTPRPATPNIDRLKEMLARFKKPDADTDSSLLDRLDSNDLCKWSNKVLKYLPTVDDTKNASGNDSQENVTHFNTLKV